MKNQFLAKHIPLSVAVAALLCAPSSRADQQVSAAFGVPLHVNAIVDEIGCNNSPGPQITLGGEIKMGGVKARVILSNNLKGTHTTVVVDQFDVDLLIDGGSIVLPKQPVLGGVGGNPYIYLQFHDGKGNNLDDEIFLGRCVQGLGVTADLLNQVLTLLNVHADGCSNHPGPYITLDGNIVLSGLHARFIFRNNVKGIHTAQDVRDLTLIVEGSKITIPKQPSQGGSGGNPLISIQFLRSNGEVITQPVLLGRCVQL